MLLCLNLLCLTVTVIYSWFSLQPGVQVLPVSTAGLLSLSLCLVRICLLFSISDREEIVCQFVISVKDLMVFILLWFVGLVRPMFQIVFFSFVNYLVDSNVCFGGSAGLSLLCVS